MFATAVFTRFVPKSTFMNILKVQELYVEFVPGPSRFLQFWRKLGWKELNWKELNGKELARKELGWRVRARITVTAMSNSMILLQMNKNSGRMKMS